MGAPAGEALGATKDDEEERLRSVALQNAQSILLARRRADEALRKQSEWLRVTLSSIGDAVISTDAEGRVAFMNGIAESLTGWPQAEALGRPLPDVFHIINEQSRQPVENPALRALREGVIVGLANRTVLIARDGTERLIDDSAAPIRYTEGEVVGCVLVFRDITERRRTDRALRESEARLLAILEQLPVGVGVMDRDGRFTLSNSVMRGYIPETIPSRDPQSTGQWRALAADGRPLEPSQWPGARALRGETVSPGIEFAFRGDDGREFWTLVSAVPFREAHEKAVGAIAVVQDITDRKRAETLLSCQKQALEMLTQGAPLLEVLDFLVRTIENQSSVGMRAAIHLLDEAGTHFREVAAPSLPESYHRATRIAVGADQGPCCRVVATRQPVIVTDLAAERQWPAFAQFALPLGIRSGWSTPIFSSGQRVLGTVAIYYPDARDPNAQDQQSVEMVTRTVAIAIERKWAEEAQRKLTAELSEADRRKNEFLAMLAHELRNPLAPIRNALQIVRLTKGNGEAVRSASEMMERQVGQLVRLVDDLLDVSRISRGKIALRKGRVELASAVNHAVEAARPLCESRDHELTVTLPPEPIYLNADPTRLAQIVGNLLNNACKFTERGGRIRLTVEQQDMEAVIRLRDTGIGIAADQLPRIFEMFTQVDTSLERSVGGLGIGLMLVKNLVEMHGGAVEVHSAGIGQGSEFVVHLPILVETAKLPPEPTVSEPTPTTARRILVVDDNPDSAESLAILLQLSGNETHMAHDGLEAVEAAERFRPHMVLLDIGLPKLNGYEVCRRIREQPWGKTMVLIALTGWGQEEDRRQSKDAGFDAHLVKPVDYGALMKLLALPSEQAG